MDYGKVMETVVKTKKIVTDESLRAAIKVKGEADFVTAVDLAVSEYLKEELHRLAPEIGFMSEEEETGELSSTRWILDPIDGTTNLIYDYRMSSVSLALMENGVIVFGVVYNPFSDEIFHAEKGKGAFLDGKPIHTVDRPIKNCLIEFGAGSTIKAYADLAFQNAAKIFKSCLDLRRICSSALAISYIAAGRINGYFEKRLKPWDYAAASLILTEAGGKICGWDNNPLQFDRESGVIAGSPQAYDFLFETVMR